MNVSHLTLAFFSLTLLSSNSSEACSRENCLNAAGQAIRDCKENARDQLEQVSRGPGGYQQRMYYLELLNGGCAENEVSRCNNCNEP